MLILIKSLFLFLKFLKVYVISSVYFFRLIKKKNHELFTIFLRDVNKALHIKLIVNFVTLLFLKYYNFLNVFFRELTNILVKRLFYDYKIFL